MSTSEYTRVQFAERCVFWALLILYISPLWLFSYIPTQDGPQHLHTAELLRALTFDPDSPAHKFYCANWQFQPNLAIQCLSLWLLAWLPALATEKLLISAYVLITALAYRWFLVASKTSLACAPLVMVVVYATPFQMGFYNFCMSVSLSWIIVAMFRHWEVMPQWRHAIAFGSLFALCYITHLVGAAIAAVITLSMAIASARERRKLLIIQLIGITPVALVASLRVFSLDAPEHIKLNIAQAITDACRLGDWLFSAQEAQGWPVGQVMVTFYEFLLVGLFFGREKVAHSRLGISVALVLLTMLYILTPDSFGQYGSLLKMRIAMYFPLLVPALIGPLTRRWRWAVLCACFAVASINLVACLAWLEHGNRLIHSFIAGKDSLPSECTLGAECARSAIGYADPLEHAICYYCLGRNRYSVNNYQAESVNFPLRWRDDAYPLSPEFHVLWGVHNNWHENRGPQAVFWQEPLLIVGTQPSDTK